VIVVKDSELVPRLLVTTGIGRERRVCEDITNALFFRNEPVEVRPLERRGLVIVYSCRSCDPWALVHALRGAGIAGAFWAIPIQRSVPARYEYVARGCLDLVLLELEKHPVRIVAVCRKRGNYIDSCSRLCRYVGEYLERLGIIEVDFRRYEYILRIEIVDSDAHLSIYRRDQIHLLRLS